MGAGTELALRSGPLRASLVAALNVPFPPDVYKLAIRSKRREIDPFTEGLEEVSVTIRTGIKPASLRAYEAETGSPGLRDPSRAAHAAQFR